MGQMNAESVAAMSPTNFRSPADILRSRGIGLRVGTLIGACWMAYGLLLLPGIERILIGAAGLVAMLLLLGSSQGMIASAAGMAAPDATAQAANRRAWKLFWINLAAEIVLLNIAINLLAQPALHIYWVPAISLVVGLHFFPMAAIFRMPSYGFCGAAMVAIAAVTALLVRTGLSSPGVLPAAEAIANAVVLWSTGAWGIQSAARLRQALE